MKILPVGAELLMWRDRRTDRHDEANSRFSQFCERAQKCPEVAESSVPGVFPGGKGGRCVRLTTLPPSCAVVMKSGNLNFLETSGPL